MFKATDERQPLVTDEIYALYVRFQEDQANALLPGSNEDTASAIREVCRPRSRSEFEEALAQMKGEQRKQYFDELQLGYAATAAATWDRIERHQAADPYRGYREVLQFLKHISSVDNGCGKGKEWSDRIADGIQKAQELLANEQAPRQGN